MSNYSNKSTRIEKPSEINNHKGNLSVSIFSGLGESVSSETPDNLCIYRENKIKKTPDTLIIRKNPIKEPVNRSLYIYGARDIFLLLYDDHETLYT